MIRSPLSYVPCCLGCALLEGNLHAILVVRVFEPAVQGFHKKSGCALPCGEFHARCILCKKYPFSNGEIGGSGHIVPSAISCLREIEPALKAGTKDRSGLARNMLYTLPEDFKSEV